MTTLAKDPAELKRSVRLAREMGPTYWHRILCPKDKYTKECTKACQHFSECKDLQPGDWR